MEFLNPLALFALAAAAIPLIIHLFNFRRPRKVDFSSLAFVKELQKSTMQRVRIKQWLLLLLRMMAIAFLVLAFARPTLTGDIAGTLGGRASSSVAVVVDNSLSMTLRDSEGEYLRQAKDILAGVIDELGTGDEIILIPAAGDAGAVRYTNVGSALEAMEELEPASGSGSIPQAVSRAADALRNASNVNREIYVATDLQETAFADTVRTAMVGNVRTYLLPVGSRTHSNVAVTDVRVESRIIEVGQPVRISSTLVNHGSDPVDDYVASVFLEGERVAQATADLPPEVPTTVTFTATPQSRGWLSGVVRIEDDAFEFDNDRFFTLHVPEQRRVLVIRGEGQETEFIRLALSPELGRGRVSFDVTIVPETGLAASGLGGYDAVVLVGPASLSSGEIAAIDRYVSGGGGLLLTPSAQGNVEDYNALLQTVNGGDVSGFSGSLGSSRTIAAFERVDLEHPLFEGVFSRQGLREQTRVESPDIYFLMNYTSGTGSEQTLIGLSNGFPFLQEIRDGSGVVFLLAVAPSARWSDLPVRGLFVPLIYRSLYYLSASESVSGEQVTASHDSELRVPRATESEQLHLVGPDGTEYVPEQRNLFGALLLTIEGSAVRTPGIYDILAGEERVRRIAVNVDVRESDLRSLPSREGRERLAEALGADVELIDADDARPAEVVQSILQQRTGVELWNLFLLMSLICLIAEMVVAKRWRPETVTA